jgi:hypothetical protein
MTSGCGEDQLGWSHVVLTDPALKPSWQSREDDSMGGRDILGERRITRKH